MLLSDRLRGSIDVTTLLSIHTFLKYIPRFKQDIVLAQDAKWPADEAPLDLPESVAILLSNLCEMSKQDVDSLWTYLRESIWQLEERDRETDEQFKLHGKDLSYSTQRLSFMRCILCTKALCSCYIPSP